ncbi:MAG: cytosolic protein [Rhodospirillales bacterium]|nr:cytosolic protein [Rhodospirillales bacterium]
MKTAMLFTGSGPLVILTSHKSLTDPALLEKLAGKGIDKFIAYELPEELAKDRYGGHFFVVVSDLRESDDLRILDFNGERAFQLFNLHELKGPIMYDAELDSAA